MTFKPRNYSQRYCRLGGSRQILMVGSHFYRPLLHVFPKALREVSKTCPVFGNAPLTIPGNSGLMEQIKFPL